MLLRQFECPAPLAEGAERVWILGRAGFRGDLDEMGNIYYKGFSKEEITRFEECLDRIRKNLEEWQKS